MATRSNIAIENQDGSISAIYCHHDGYIDGVGKVLQENYNTREKMEQLIALGDISSLGKTIEETLAYHRDMGDKFQEPMQHKTVPLYFENQNFDIEYSYCFTLGGQFLVQQSNSNHVALLEGALAGEDVL